MLGLKLIHVSKRGHWWGRGIGCHPWVKILISVLSLLLQSSKQYYAALDFIIMESDWTIYNYTYPDSKVHGANMGPTLVLSTPDGPHVGPMNFAIWVAMQIHDSDSKQLNCHTKQCILHTKTRYSTGHCLKPYISSNRFYFDYICISR